MLFAKEKKREFVVRSNKRLLTLSLASDGQLCGHVTLKPEFHNQLATLVTSQHLKAFRWKMPKNVFLTKT